MKRAVLLSFVIFASLLAFAKQKPAQKPASQKSTSAASSKAAPATTAAGLESVLNSMDKAAANFHSAQVDFLWDQFESVVNDHTKQKGTMYIRKNGNDMEMAADINDPPSDKKYVLFTDGKVQLYQPNIDQVTQYSAGKNKEAFQSFLVLGFGGRGHDLSKQFDVKYAGTEKVAGIDAAKLELTPKSDRVRGMFNPIVLWIDPARGVSVQQQFFEPGSGNYRLADYSNIKIDTPISPAVFKLKTTPKTKYVTPGM